MRNVITKKINFNLEKDFKINPENVPVITGVDYQKRINELWKLADGKYTHIIVYADREHFSNMEYLTGFDPRFEEALLILSQDAKPMLIVGLEGLGYCKKINFDINVELFTTFGLAGQPRKLGKRLPQLLAEAGINEKSKVGLAGWKCYIADDFEEYNKIFDVPHYIVACIEKLSKSVYNCADLFTSNEYGIRHNLDAKEIILAEIASTKISRSTYNAIKSLEEGMNEVEASKLLQFDGEALCTHPSMSFGMPNVSYGLQSPLYHKKLVSGETTSVGMAYRRSNCHRLNLFVKDESEMPEGSMDYFFIPYFISVVKWYEAMKIGVTGGEIYDTAMEPLGSYEKFGVVLNPGHLIHTDEWSNAPFYKNSKVQIRSGMLIQCDYTVSWQNPVLLAHIEDGIAIADASLRAEIEKLAPATMRRINARRKLMTETLGIKISEEVLPLSDIQGMMFIYGKDTSVVLAVEV